MSLLTKFTDFTASVGQHFAFIPLLLLRLYLAPIMIQAGWNKLSNFESTVTWFGNPDWGLGLPFPEIMAALAAGTEFFGGVLILLGLATRLVAVPLAVTMGVAMITVHAKNGWLAIADSSSWLADGTLYLDERVMAAEEKISAAYSVLDQHGHMEWLTSSGKFVVLNNGIEFAATYLIMFMVLFCYGGGRYLSVDYYLARQR